MNNMQRRSSNPLLKIACQPAIQYTHVDTGSLIPLLQGPMILRTYVLLNNDGNFTICTLRKRFVNNTPNRCWYPMWWFNQYQYIHIYLYLHVNNIQSTNQSIKTNKTEEQMDRFIPNRSEPDLESSFLSPARSDRCVQWWRWWENDLRWELFKVFLYERLHLSENKAWICCE